MLLINKMEAAFSQPPRIRLMSNLSIRTKVLEMVTHEGVSLARSAKYEE
jgi:hypothetical protein